MHNMYEKKVVKKNGNNAQVTILKICTYYYAKYECIHRIFKMISYNIINSGPQSIIIIYVVF